MYFDDSPEDETSNSINSWDQDGKAHMLLTRIVMGCVHDYFSNPETFLAADYYDWRYEIAETVIGLGNKYLQTPCAINRGRSVWEFLEDEGYDCHDQELSYITTCVHLYISDLY